ncbi:MAG: hypothetical protein ABTQ25_01030 [Nitrosomonas ureae]
MKQHSSEMKNAITATLRKHSELERFLGSDELHYRIEKPNFLPLVVERQLTATHYRKENGALIADPDMEFLLGADGEWNPVALQLWNGSYYRARWSEDGKEFINPKQVREQVTFARMWARNLRGHGW